MVGGEIGPTFVRFHGPIGPAEASMFVYLKPCTLNPGGCRDWIQKTGIKLWICVFLATHCNWREAVCVGKWV
jgi:hypothetical protein